MRYKELGVNLGLLVAGPSDSFVAVRYSAGFGLAKTAYLAIETAYQTLYEASTLAGRWTSVEWRSIILLGGPRL